MNKKLSVEMSATGSDKTIYEFKVYNTSGRGYQSEVELREFKPCAIHPW